VRTLTAVRRTPKANLRLGATLAFVAGAVNAGGFLAIGRYTSHMTGIVSSMADYLAVGQVALALAALGGLLAFLFGAMTTAVLVNWARRRRLHSRYALPLLLEALLLLLFGLLGGNLDQATALLVPVTALVLCFVMGLQNAVITKLSRAEIRTTHVTGLVTDIGIELGKLVYVNVHRHQPLVLADRRKLKVHTLLFAMFFTGGVLGALGFSLVGYSTTVPLAALLFALCAAPMAIDARIRLRVMRRHDRERRRADPASR
jgi:uncharacterized membrane protein YoaK (UPF0700 family)